MANVIATLQLENYVTDFGETIAKLPFKFEENDQFSDASGVTGITYTVRDESINCSSNSLFSPRKLKILFENGTSTELPVDTLDRVQVASVTAKNTSGVACVSLIGEKWAKVPPAKLGGNTNLYSGDAIAGAIKPPRQSISFDYQLDGNSSSTSIRKAFQIEPDEIFQSQISCLENPDTSNSIVCTFAGNIDLRHFIGTRAKIGGGSIARKIYVSDGTPAQIASCGLAVAPQFNCLAYQGTTIGDVSLFYAT